MFNFMEIDLSDFLLYVLDVYGIMLRTLRQVIDITDFSHIHSSKSVIVLNFTKKYMINFDIIFLN